MKRTLCAWFLISTVPFAVVAQDRSLDFVTGQVDSCDENRAYIGLNYANVSVSPRDTLRFLSTVCIARDGSWFVGPDTVTGFTQTMEFPGEGGMYEVIDEATDTPGRSILTVGTVSDLFPFDIGANIIFYNVILNATASGPMPQANLISGQGHGVDSELEQLSSLPDGRWLTYVYPARAVHYIQPSVDFGHGELGQRPIVLGVGDEALPPVQTPSSTAENFKWHNVNMTIDIIDHTITASFSFDYKNPKLNEARGPIEYDLATIEMDQVIGQSVRTSTGGAIVAQGAGRIVARTNEGSEHVYPAWFDIVSVRVPDTFSDAALDAFLNEE